jgi:hypothetical protein
MKFPKAYKNNLIYIYIFNKIQNPETGNWVNVNGPVGRRVLQNYSRQFGGMMAVKSPNSPNKSSIAQPKSLKVEKAETAAAAIAVETATAAVRTAERALEKAEDTFGREQKEDKELETKLELAKTNKAKAEKDALDLAKETYSSNLTGLNDAISKCSIGYYQTANKTLSNLKKVKQKCNTTIPPGSARVSTRAWK